MESMERIDVLKGIEKILIEKAYEIGHISHRADGDWQKQADGSWTPYTGQSTQSTSQAQEPAPAEFSDLDKYVAKLPNTDLAEDSDEVTNVVSEYLADHGIDDNDDDFIAVRSAIMEKLNGDRYGEITEEDLIETPKFDSDNEEKNFLKEEYGIDPATYKDSDVQAIRHDLSTTYGMSGDQLEYVADLIVNNLPEDDEPSDDEIYDYEDDLANEEDKFNQYKISHPKPALSNDGHSKGLPREKDMFEEAVERFRELTDPYNDERLTAGVEKSAVRDMRSAPVIKNMGF